jgi:hypothetical protein
VLGDDERAAEHAAQGVVGHLALQAPAGEVVVAGEVEAQGVAVRFETGLVDRLLVPRSSCSATRRISAQRWTGSRSSSRASGRRSATSGTPWRRA